MLGAIILIMLVFVSAIVYFAYAISQSLLADDKKPLIIFISIIVIFACILEWVFHI